MYFKHGPRWIVGLVLALALHILFVPQEAKSTSITSGSVWIGSIGDFAPVTNLHAENFSLSCGCRLDPFPPSVGPGLPYGIFSGFNGGAVVNLDTSVHWDDRLFDRKFLTVDGVSGYAKAARPSPLNFSIGDVTVPHAPPVSGPTTTVSAPFSFGGNIFQVDGLGKRIGPDLELTGEGTLHVTFLNIFPLNRWFINSMAFNFANPNPEPSSMILLGSGLAILALLRRRRSQT